MAEEPKGIVSGIALRMLAEREGGVVVFRTPIDLLDILSVEISEGNPWGMDDDQWTAPEPTRYVPKECMCTSRELLLHGCTCGYVDKKSWDEKLKNIDQRK